MAINKNPLGKREEEEDGGDSPFRRASRLRDAPAGLRPGAGTNGDGGPRDGPPLFRAPSAQVIVTGVDAAARLRDRIAAQPESSGVEIVARDETSLRDVVHWLGTERGCGTVLVEAGASTSRALYDEPLAVDELMLSICDASELAPAARGEIFARRDDPLRP